MLEPQRHLFGASASLSGRLLCLASEEYGRGAIGANNILKQINVQIVGVVLSRWRSLTHRPVLI